MKLLIITQKVDKKDDLLGFFNGWLFEFANYFDEVSVICLEKGDFFLPNNVKVFSLGKEQRSSRLKYFCRFYYLIWCLRKDYDRVFVHMNPEYVVLGGLLWKIFNKPIFLWYAHRLVDLKLQISEKFVKKIFTPAQESFQLKSNKIIITGHGIDISKFKILVNPQKNDDNIFNIICVGRISKIKHQDLLIRAVDDLVNVRGLKKIHVALVGGVDNISQLFFSHLKEEIKIRELEKYIYFIGSVPYEKIQEIYSKANLSINLCPLGGLDKVVLESMAMGVPVISSNISFQREFGIYKKYLLVEEGNSQDLANKIETLMKTNLKERFEIGNYLQNYVAEYHNLEKLIKFLSYVIKE